MKNQTARVDSRRSDSVNLYETGAGVELTHDLGPKSLEGGEQNGGATVADSQPDDAHTFGAQDGQLGKILVLGNDHRAGSRRVLPDQRIVGLRHSEGKNVFGLMPSRLQPARERGGQLVIDKETRHEAAA